MFDDFEAIFIAIGLRLYFIRFCVCLKFVRCVCVCWVFFFVSSGLLMLLHLPLPFAASLSLYSNPLNKRGNI